MSEVRSDLSKYKGTITSLVESVNGIDLRAHESLAPAQLAAILKPITSKLLSAADALVGDVWHTYEAEGIHHEPVAEPCAPFAAPYLSYDKAIDCALQQKAPPLRTLEDIVFLTRLELRERSARLNRVGSKNALAIIGECDTTRRRILKALTGIDVALARAGLVEPSLQCVSELEMSLRVRAAYGRFRGDILGHDDPTPEAIEERLRGAATAVAGLVNWDDYPLLRVRDRLQLRDLERRIGNWLREEKEPSAGMRLWGDLVVFVRVISQVNHRHELVLHDRRTAEKMRDHVAACAGAILDEPALGAARVLEGLDDEVDELLETRDARAETWRGPLERLAYRLRRGEMGG